MENSVTGARNHKQATPSSPLVEVTREFNAPVERVWRAFTDAEQIKQWWGPETFSCPSAKIDFRIGGHYLYAMKDQKDQVTWSTGQFEEIVPNKKIVYTDDFSDDKGNVISPKEAGMPGEWHGTTFVTLEFFKTDEDTTKLVLTHQGIPGAMHDDCVNGWSSSIDKMQALVERH